jgi:type IV secretory pathway TraG/TraD family ATPase VirD4
MTSQRAQSIASLDPATSQLVATSDSPQRFQAIASPSPTAATTSAVPTSDTFSSIGSALSSYNTPEGWGMVGVLVFLIVISKVMGSNAGKISTGRLVNATELSFATNLAQQQIENIRLLHQVNCLKRDKQEIPPALQKKKPKHNKVTLWCGSPQYWIKHQNWQWLSAQLQTMMGKPPTVYLPDAQRSILVLGIPGCGKTFSVIDRAVESAFRQGIPVILYDKKGDQMRLHSALAARYGYDVHVYAPGEPFSGVFNPLDYMKDENDSTMARQIGEVINRNASGGDGGKGDEFFSKSGDALATALMQLCKSTPYPDMAMVYAILQMTSLVKRIEYGVKTKRIGDWIAPTFGQFLSSKDAEKTIAGIQATAALTFANFIQADLLRTFIGKSTIPSRIEGKQLIVFKLDDERRNAVGPLLAACIHLAVVKNLATPRSVPILTCLDEFPSIRLNAIVQWINEYRSNGGCFILGIQSLNQLYDAYGEKLGTSIAAGCSTHILFNPGDPKTAEEYSKRYGEREVTTKSRSTSQSTGGQGSRSVSWNESLQKMPLFTVDQILRFPEGRCVITSPGYKSGNEGSVPYYLKIPVPPEDIERAGQCEKLWESHVIHRLQKRVPPTELPWLTDQLQKRIALAEEIFPLPPDGDAKGQGAKKAQSSGRGAIAVDAAKRMKSS